MRIEVWSDVVCPWCFIGKRHLDAALAASPHAGDVEVVWRSFELDPNAPREREGDELTRLATKYGVSRDEAGAMLDRVSRAGRAVGIGFRFDIARRGNSFDAHRLLHLAAERGLQPALKERLLTATFTEGEPTADHATLVRLAGEVGLDEGEAAAVLASDRFADAVRADEREAAGLGISAVPFFVFDRAVGVAGAQPPAVLREAMEQARAAG